MKICHVINDLSRGGAESHLYTLVKLQTEKGNNVSLLLLGKDQSNFTSLEDNFVSLNIRILRFKGPKKLQGINPLSVIKGINYFRNHDFDIVHIVLLKHHVYLVLLLINNLTRYVVHLRVLN